MRGRSGLASAASGDILRVENLVKHFPLTTGVPWFGSQKYVHAVDGVSVAIRRRETLGLVGESGCGKTTVAKLMLRLERPTAGRVLFEGVDLETIRGAQLRRYRASVQAVFQDPWSSLSPRMRADSIIAEPLLVNTNLRDGALRSRIGDLLVAVGLDPSIGKNYPHEFSGGMRQRLAIARALALSPSLIVLDEPVSSLDVSVRAQVMNLLKDLQSKVGLTYVLIAHDLSTVRYLTQRVCVMYLGKIVETGATEALFRSPRHPYTVALMSAASGSPGRHDKEEIVLEGEVPASTRPPQGCRFHTRCWLRTRLGGPVRCTSESPELREVGPTHTACHFAERLI